MRNSDGTVTVEPAELIYIAAGLDAARVKWRASGGLPAPVERVYAALEAAARDVRERRPAAPTEDLVDVVEVARLLGVSPRQARTVVRCRLGGRRVAGRGRPYVVDRARVQRFADTRRLP
jgi:hypothetical protein